MSVNVVSISGNLGGDPEVRVTQGGTSVLSFSVAVSERVRNTNGEWEDRPNWVPCVIFGRRAEALGRLLSKGSRVALSGRLHESRWLKDDQRRSRLELVVSEVEFLSPARGMGGEQAMPQIPVPQQAMAAVADEDIPF